MKVTNFAWGFWFLKSVGENLDYSLWVLYTEALDEVLSFGGVAAKVFFGEVKVDLRDVEERLLLGVASERRDPCQHHVRQHPDAPHVCGQRDGLIVEDLWSWN